MNTWTKDKPTTGKWRVSIAPEKRTSDAAFKYMFDGPVSRCEVASYELEQGKRQLHVSITDNSEFRCLYPLTDPWFDGALLMRDEHPVDPFAELERTTP